MLHPVFIIIFVLQTLSWCQISGKIQEQRFYSDQTHTAFQEAFQEDLKYSDFFRDHLLQPQHIGDIRREFIFYGLEKAKLDSNRINLHNRAENKVRKEH